MIALTNEYIQSYNQSIPEAEPAQTLNLQLAKEQINKFVWITGEDKAYHISIPLQ